MPDDQIEIEELADLVVKYAREQNWQLQKPVLTLYGWGWIPTITFWNGMRRVHVYDNIQGSFRDGELWVDGVDGWFVELADRSETKLAPPTIQQCLVRTPEEVWHIVSTFLGEEDSVSKLDLFEWTVDTAGVEYHIPHPPNENPSSFGIWPQENQAFRQPPILSVLFRKVIEWWKKRIDN